MVLYPTNTHEAAIVDNHLFDAVRITRECYDGDERGANRWLVMQLIVALGYDESVSYPIVDYLEREDDKIRQKKAIRRLI